MARGDLYPMPGGAPGYVLDVQADLLASLKTRVVVPMLPAETAPKAFSTQLNPAFTINNAAHVMVTQSIATMKISELKPACGSSRPHLDVITNALDFLFTGF